jgi:hypothetical protein
VCCPMDLFPVGVVYVGVVLDVVSTCGASDVIRDHVLR